MTGSHAYSGYVAEALGHVFPSTVAPEDRFVVNILGYFDASGHHDGSPALAVAGFVGRPDDWGGFEYQWRMALDGWGLEAFHMREFAHSRGAFDTDEWRDEAEREKRFGRLLRIILAYSMGSVGVTVPLPLYQAVMDPLVGTHAGGAFSLAAFMSISHVAEMVRSLSGQPHVAYVFDNDPGYGQFAKIFHDNMARSEQRFDLRLLSLSFQRKEEYVPLQAADILAYELHRRHPQEREAVAKGEPFPAARLPLRVLASQPHTWAYLTDEELRATAMLLERGFPVTDAPWTRGHLNPQSGRRSPRKSKHDR